MSTKPKLAKKSVRKKKLNGSKPKRKRTKTVQARSKPNSTKPGTKKDGSPRLLPAPEEGEVFIRIGENIRRIRKEKNWTMEKMADFGFEWRYYQRIEMGKRNLTLRVLVRLASALEVDISELMASKPADAANK